MTLQRVKPLTWVLALLFSTALHAQTETPMADAMRNNGKIYVVVAVLVIIFIGISVYLVQLDVKTAKLKRQIEEMKK